MLKNFLGVWLFRFSVAYSARKRELKNKQKEEERRRKDEEKAKQVLIF